MNNSWEDNGAMKVKLDLREPTKPWRCVLAVVSWGIQGSVKTRKQLAGKMRHLNHSPSEAVYL